MTSYMTIMVRVASTKAQAAMAAMRGEVAGLSSGISRVNKMEPLGARHITSLMKFGNQLQWTGRMLQYNFTLPLLLAGGAAMKWQLDNEAAFTHVAKVYGDVTAAAQQFRKESNNQITQSQAEAKARRVNRQELEALDQAFTAISNHYGVQKKQVLEVAGAWAAAGASGRNLAEAVNQTMQAIIIGDMDAGAATKALISIQAQYNLSTKQLQATLANLNAVENQTGADMADLITGFEKAAGMARSAGVDTKHLAAYMAALVPATGSAASAGNALKTIFSRLMAPTKESIQVMKAMGLHINKLSWQSSTATERLKLMSVQFNNLHAAAQNAASSVIASRWQVNRFGVLMREIGSKTGYYAKAIQAASDQGKTFTMMQKELNTVLESDPRRLQRMWVMLQNAMTQVIQPLIPYVIYLADRLAYLAKSFSGLEPHLQKLILLGLGLLAAVGPIVRYLGALTTLYGTFGNVVIFAGKAVGFFGGALNTLAIKPVRMALSLLFDVVGWLITGFATATGSFLTWMGVMLTAPFKAVATDLEMMGVTGFGSFIRMTTLASLAFASFIFGLVKGTTSVGLVPAWQAVWRGITALFLAGYSWITGLTVSSEKAIATATALGAATRTKTAEGEQTARAAIATAGNKALMRLQDLYNADWLIREKGTTGEYISIGESRAAARAAVDEAMYGYLLNLFNAYNAAYYGLEAGASTKRLAIASATSSELVAIEAAMSTALAAQQASGIALRITAMEAYYAALIRLLQAYWAQYIAIEIAGGAEYLALGAKTYAQFAWITEEFYQYLIGLEAAYFSNRMGLAAAASTERLALEAASGAQLVAVADATGAALVATEAAVSKDLVVIDAASSAKRVGIMARMKSMMAVIGSGLLRVLASPWVLAIAAIIGLLWHFRDQIKAFWSSVMNYFRQGGGGVMGMMKALGQSMQDVFNRLPQSVQNAMLAVVQVVKSAALAVYDWFQYINPWAHHSPSLVDNVSGGMAHVGRHLSKVKDTGKHFKSAYSDINSYGKAVSNAGSAQRRAAAAPTPKLATHTTSGGGDAISAFVNRSNQAEQKQTQSQISKFSPAAAAEYGKLAKQVAALTAKMNGLNAAMKAQQAVVDGWQKKLDQANAVLQEQQNRLEKLQAVQQKWSDALSAAQDRLSNFANAPLKGMQAMDDQIHKNQMSQTKLKLAMMKMEDVVGPLDQIKSKLDAINGAQEILRGQQTDLRHQGAGSEILKQFDTQIAKLDKQKSKYAQTTDALDKMSTRLDALQRQADKLDLVKAMKFDDLQYQIDKAANSMKEMSFDQIMSGIKNANRDIKNYSSKVDEATKAVDRQQKAVDRATRARDRIQKALDRESKKLDNIKNHYDAVSQSIQDMTQKMQDAASAAGQMQQAADAKKKKKQAGAGSKPYITPGLQNFLDAGKADFPDPGGKGIPPRKNWDSQVKGIDAFTKQLSDQTTKAFANLNPFVPLVSKAKEFWNKFKGWALDAAHTVGKSIGGALGNLNIGGGKTGKFLADFKGDLKSVGKFVTQVFKDIGKAVKWGWDLVGPDVKKFVSGFIGGIGSIFRRVGPELDKFGKLLKPAGQAIKNLYVMVRPILALLGTVITILVKLVSSVLAEVIEPLMKNIGDFLAGFIRTVRGIFEVIIGILTLNKKLIWSGIKDIFSGLGKMLWNIVQGAFTFLIDVFAGIVKGIVHWFKWLYDILVGHSIVPDLVDKIKKIFGYLTVVPKWIWNHVLKPIVDFFKDTFKKVVDHLKGWWDGIKKAWNSIKSNVSDWWTSNVWNPVKNKITDWWKERLRVWKSWWDAIKNAWSNIKSNIASWWMDSVWNPVKNKITNWWHERLAVWRGWWGDIKNAWASIKNNIAGWWGDAMDKVKEKITNVWNDIKGWLSDNKDKILSPMKAIINGVISAVDAIINGINKVSDILPGVEFHVSTIQKLEDGGAVPSRRGNRGFKTNGARAIVGEGKPNHPEFVIPTDPTYRQRAIGLLAMAARKLNVGPGGDASDVARMAKEAGKTNPMGVANAIPKFGVGGWLSDAWNGVKNVGGKVADLSKKAISKIMDPALNYAEGKIKKVGWQPAESPPLYMINKLRGWVSQGESDLQTAVSKYDGGPGAKRALKYAHSMVGTPYLLGGFGPGGIDCSGFMSAVSNVYRGKPPYSWRGTTASFPWPGWMQGVGADKGMTVGSTKMYPGSAYGHMAGTVGGVNVESRGGTGVIVGKGARGWNDPGFSAVYHLAQGGIAKARRGGVLAKIGEAGYDEAVVPLPKDWRNNLSSIGNGSGDLTININGDLSFPNMTDGNDVKTFIKNLTVLAKD